MGPGLRRSHCPTAGAVTGSTAPHLRPTAVSSLEVSCHTAIQGLGYLSPKISHLHHCSHTLKRPPPLAVPFPELHAPRPRCLGGRPSLHRGGERGSAVGGGLGREGTPETKGLGWDSDREKPGSGLPGTCRGDRPLPSGLRAQETGACQGWAATPTTLPLPREQGGSTGVSLLSRRGTPNVVKASISKPTGAFTLEPCERSVSGLSWRMRTAERGASLGGFAACGAGDRAGTAVSAALASPVQPRGRGGAQETVTASSLWLSLT